MPVSQMDEALLRPFADGVVSALQVQGKTRCQPRPARLVESIKIRSTDVRIQIVGAIIVDTKKLNGWIALSFSEDVFAKVYENMFGEKCERVDPTMHDAAAELLNIAYCAAKKKLNSQAGFDLQLAIPVVLDGEALSEYQRTKEKLIVMPFVSDAGDFQLELALENK